MSDPAPSFGNHLLHDLEGRELKQARAILIVLGLLTIIYNLLAYNKLTPFGAEADGLRQIVIAEAVVGGIFLACGLIVMKKPLLATSVGLGLYLAMLSLQLAISPAGVVGDLFAIGVRGAIVIGLVSAFLFARQYTRSHAAKRATASRDQS
jgi:hypothetical protein